MRKALKISKGSGGWGGPLVVSETDTRKYVVSITGGGLHPLAVKIGELLGVEVKDGFSAKIEAEEMICVVIDCGGTARCGVYPKMNVMTINVRPTPATGPLKAFIKETNYVSDVKEETLQLVDDTNEQTTTVEANEDRPLTKEEAKAIVQAAKEEAGSTNVFVQFITNLGRGVGNVVGKFYQAGRDAIDVAIRNILPFMAFVSVIVGVINYTGIGDVIANALKPLAGNIIGLVIISLVCSIPFLSPVLGPGAVIAQIIGALLGSQIAAGVIPVSMALPALFAINAQVGADFIPVGLTLAEAEPYTVEVGVPAVLFSRLITGPVSVLLAWLLSVGL